MPKRSPLLNNFYLLPYPIYLKGLEESDKIYLAEVKEEKAAKEKEIVSIEKKMEELDRIEEKRREREKQVQIEIEETEKEYKDHENRLKEERANLFHEASGEKLKFLQRIKDREIDSNRSKKSYLKSKLLGAIPFPEMNTITKQRTELLNQKNRLSSQKDIFKARRYFWYNFVNWENEIIAIRDVTEESILSEDHIVINVIQSCPTKVALPQNSNAYTISVYPYKVEVIKKIDFIDCLNFKRIIQIVHKPENEKYDLILFGDLLWSINDQDYLLKETELMLLMLEQVDNDRKKFEKLKRKFFDDRKTQQENKRTKIPEDVRIFVWRRDQGKCVKCGSRHNLEYDHIIPVSKGGSNTARNIELLCQDCNRKKSDQIM